LRLCASAFFLFNELFLETDHMKKLVFLTLIATFSPLLLQAQKSKVITTLQLIDASKFSEAKITIEEAIEDNNTDSWHKTWYVRGLLCQTAYQEGVAKNDKKKYELYPDQLYVAYDSYEKALVLDKKGRINDQLAPLYVLLANEFQKTGENHYKNKKYEDAFKAFEHALFIQQSDILSVQVNPNLMYNTALAAYESKNPDKAVKYLSELNKDNYSPNVPHLLYTIYLEQEDTLAAKNILDESIRHYDDNEDLVLLLADLLLQTNNSGRAVTILDSISLTDTANYIYPFTTGVVYQKTEQYDEAISAYEKAARLTADKAKIYANMGICYYNIGVEIQENARSITNNKIYLEEKAKTTAAFGSAMNWLEKAYEKDPRNQKVVEKLYELYSILGITDKIKKLEDQVK